MSKIAYLECPSGLAGDMCLGALIDAGVPLNYLIEQLHRLGMAHEYHLWSEFVQRNGQQATKVHVDLGSPGADPVPMSAEEGVDPHTTFAQARPLSDHAHHADPAHQESHHHAVNDAHRDARGGEAIAHYSTRHLPEIEQLIQFAYLPQRVETWSLAVFRQLAVAEGAVHGIAPEQVHFHEVGATDAIVDIVGTCLGLDWLGIDALYCSPMPTGGGTVRAAHGVLPVPTPAVLKLWEMRQVPIYHNGINRELVTPTGAAIATTLATAFGAPPPMMLHKIGLGAGSRQLPIPNMVRLWIGVTDLPTPPQTNPATVPIYPTAAPQPPINPELQRAQDSHSSLMQETVTVLETQIDDVNPQAIGYLMEALLQAGALDVFTQAVGMKKSRPGILVTVICHADGVDRCERLLFQETTTLGVRRSCQQRSILQREIVSIATPHGVVRLKVARWGREGAIANVQPEYEDCAQLAQQLGLPWRHVQQTALYHWQLNQLKAEQEGAIAPHA